MSAKGSALGASVPEGGVAPKRALAPRNAGGPKVAGVSGNGTKRSHRSRTGTNFEEAGIAETPETSAGSIAAESSHPALASSYRTLILGIDYDGRILQPDRNAPQTLARAPAELLAAQLCAL